MAADDASDRSASDRFVGNVDVTHWRTPAGRWLSAGHDRLSRRIGTHGALVASLAAGLAVTTVSAFAVTRIYDGVADDNGIEMLDRPVLSRAKTFRSPVTDAAAAGIARVFGPIGMPIIAISAGTALAIRRRRPTPITLVGAAGIGSLLMTLGGKDMIHRHRPPRRDAIPPYESSPSFPSGHTLNATTVAGILAYLLVLHQQKRLPQILTLGGAGVTAIVVGLSRVLLGAHWFSDVVVGWVSGTGWLALAITSHRLYLTTRHGSH